MSEEFANQLVEHLSELQVTLDRIEGQLDDFLARHPVDVNVNANYGAVQQR